MTMPWEHPERGALWDSRGFTIASNPSLHVVPSAKLDDFRSRTVDKNAISCVVPFIGSYELNSSCWIALKKNLEFNNIKFLIPAEQKQELLEDSGQYFHMNSEELAEALVPHILTEQLIQEAVGLSSEIKDGKVRLYEPRNSTKDLIVILSYLSYIADRLENEWSKYLYNESNGEEYENIQLVY